MKLITGRAEAGPSRVAHDHLFSTLTIADEIIIAIAVHVPDVEAPVIRAKVRAPPGTSVEAGPRRSAHKGTSITVRLVANLDEVVLAITTGVAKHVVAGAAAPTITCPGTCRAASALDHAPLELGGTIGAAGVRDVRSFVATNNVHLAISADISHQEEFIRGGVAEAGMPGGCRATEGATAI